MTAAAAPKSAWRGPERTKRAEHAGLSLRVYESAPGSWSFFACTPSDAGTFRQFASGGGYGSWEGAATAAEEAAERSCEG